MAGNDVAVLDGIACTRAGDVIIVLWRDPSTIPRVRALANWMIPALDGCPDGAVIMQFILPTSSPPDARTRAESDQLIRRVLQRTRRVIMTALGDALWMSVVRTILRGMFLVLGQSKLLVVTGREDEALERLREVASPRTPPRTEVEAAIASLYAALQVPHSR